MLKDKQSELLAVSRINRLYRDLRGERDPVIEDCTVEFRLMYLLSYLQINRHGRGVARMSRPEARAALT